MPNRRQSSCWKPSDSVFAQQGRPGFSDAQWADSIPKMLQAKLIQSFENYDIAHAPLRSMEVREANFQLLIDIRSFQIKTDP